MPMSPNRVQVGKSHDVPHEGSVFDVLPVMPGFLMRPSCRCAATRGLLPLPHTLDTFSDPVLGDPIAFALRFRGWMFL